MLLFVLKFFLQCRRFILCCGTNCAPILIYVVFSFVLIGLFHWHGNRKLSLWITENVVSLKLGGVFFAV